FRLTTVTINPAALSTDFTSNPTTITPGTPVTFTATTTGGTSPYTYTWNFGDGNTGTGNPVSHTYTTGGQFTVIENVTDTNGAKATATHTVGSILVVTETCPATGTVGIAVTCTVTATGGTAP